VSAQVLDLARAVSVMARARASNSLNSQRVLSHPVPFLGHDRTATDQVLSVNGLGPSRRPVQELARIVQGGLFPILEFAELLEVCADHLEDCRRGELLEKRRRLMEAWTAFATSDPTKAGKMVVPMRA
jgi:hypothetical protein